MVSKLFLSCFGILIVHLLRLQGFHNLVLDIAPNFFAFFILVYVFKMIIGSRKVSSFLIHLSSLVSLCVYELIQYFISDIFIFDYMDLMATILGYIMIHILHHGLRRPFS